MKRFLSLSIVAVTALALAAETVTPTDIMKSPDRFDKKVVTAKGAVKKFTAKTSKAGNEYFTFDLTSGKDKISVFGHGKLDKALRDGEKVEVKGTFVKEKKVGTMTFTNELDCSGKKGEKPNLKLVK